MIDAAAGGELVHIYMKHQRENQQPVGRFATRLFALHGPWPSSRQSMNAATQTQSVYISGDDSWRRAGPLVITTNLSLAITCHRHADVPWGRSLCSKHLNKTSFPRVCVIFISF